MIKQGVIKQGMIEQYDSVARIIYIELPRVDIVMLHAIFESYDGLAVVRTLDNKKGILALVATESTAPVCLELLDSIKDQIAWKFCDKPASIDALTTYREC